VQIAILTGNYAVHEKNAWLWDLFHPLKTISYIFLNRMKTRK